MFVPIETGVAQETPPALINAGDGLQVIKPTLAETLFSSGDFDTHTFRIPAIATAVNGDLIAACDARRNSAADIVHDRAIDIVYRRSTDDGKTWTEIRLLDPINGKGCSDPSLIVDRITGHVFCLYNVMSADLNDKEYRFFVQKSLDHGETWQAPIDITDQLAGPELKNAFKFITSGRGIQLRDGRLVHNFVHVGHGLIVFASDDHGSSWRPISKLAKGDESKLAQLPDDSWLVNSRISPGMRMIHRSTDQGESWTSTGDTGLPDPRCNASMIQFTAKRDGFAKDRLIFCNAGSNVRRERLTVRISYDGGQTWRHGGLIDPGPSAYSEITVLDDGSLGVLYEPGYKEIRFVRFTLEQITGRQDKLSIPYRRPMDQP